MVWPLKSRSSSGKDSIRSAGDKSLVAVRRARLQAEEPAPDNAPGARQRPRRLVPECPDGVPVTLGEVLACWRDGARQDQFPVTGLGAGGPAAAPGQRHVLYDDFVRLEILGITRDRGR